MEGEEVNIYVGNLSREITEDDLKAEFSAFGQVTTVSVIKDKFSGESRGFGFVEMPEKAQADAAIAGLNGKELKSTTLNVSEARPRSEGGRGGRPGGGGGRFGGGRPGGGGGGGGFGRDRRGGSGGGGGYR
jgi:RNA recognition motif-containing protein